MNRLIVLGLAATFGAANLAMRSMLANPPVELQPITPGVAQIGHLNISGTVTSKVVRAESLFGNSTVTTGIASGGDFRSASTSGRGFYALASATSGLTYGGFFQNQSSTGRAVYGLATGTTGANYGGYFQAAGTSARGVLGIATAPSGTTYGVYGRALSTDGYGVYGIASANSGSSAGGFFQSNSEEGNGVVGINTSTIGSTAGVYGQSASVEGYGVYGKATNPSGYGVFSQGNLHATGIISGNGSGLTNLNAAMLNGLLTLTGTSSTHIVSGQNSSTVNGASGVYGLASGTAGQTYGVQGTSGSTNGFGVFGAAPATSGPNFGGRFESGSSSGTGVFGEAKSATGGTFGVWGKSISPVGYGVYGLNSATTGVNYGVLGQTDSPDGRGVYGWINSTESGQTGGFESAGVYGRSDEPNGVGVKGVATSAGSFLTFGVYGENSGSSGAGVHGRAGLPGSYGVEGVAYQAHPANQYGVFSYGVLGASGTKAFRIDHPFDPENKYLLHYSAESPMPQNFYVGNVVTDARGYGWVQLPDYFEEINTNFKYQLTVVDGKNTEDFVLAKVALKIKDGRFLIRTSAPKVEISWRVDADRNDLFVRKDPPKDVVDKVGVEKGKYQHPELYGLGPERGMNYHPTRDKEKSKSPPLQASNRS